MHHKRITSPEGIQKREPGIPTVIYLVTIKLVSPGQEEDFRAAYNSSYLSPSNPKNLRNIEILA